MKPGTVHHDDSSLAALASKELNGRLRGPGGLKLTDAVFHAGVSAVGQP